MPQLEIMVWAGNNSRPLGSLVSSNITTVDGAAYDLWAGMNQGAGCYVYTFMPHAPTVRLPAEGSLNVDLMDFLRLLDRRQHFSMAMYLDVVEAGFEVVRGRGWVTCGWFSCDAQ